MTRNYIGFWEESVLGKGKNSSKHPELRVKMVT